MDLFRRRNEPVHDRPEPADRWRGSREYDLCLEGLRDAAGIHSGDWIRRCSILYSFLSDPFKPDLIFNATSCGENCAKWLAEIGRRENVTVNLKCYMPFDDCGDIEFEILNENIIVTNTKDYMHIALKYV